MMFAPAKGDLQGVLMNETTLAYEWAGPGKVIFSFAQRGYAISAHFSSDKKGLRHLKLAINDFCAWVFKKYKWCRMIFAMLKRPSVGRLIKKCEFNHFANKGDINIYVRLRPWVA